MNSHTTPRHSQQPTVLDDHRRRRAAAANRPPTVPMRVIDRAKAGDERAIDAIYRTYQPALLRYLRTLAPQLAEDVASQTWVSAMQSLHRFNGDGRGLRGWILTIGRRRMVDEIRRTGRAPIPTDDVPDEAIEVGDRGEEWARHMLRKLPARQADVLLLRVIGGLSVDETAAVLGISSGNVRVLSHRGLNRLNELLSEAEGPLAEIRDLPLSG